MSITFRCDCGRMLRADDGHAGLTSRCPVCSQVVNIPSQDQPVPRDDGPTYRLAPDYAAPPPALRRPLLHADDDDELRPLPHRRLRNKDASAPRPLLTDNSEADIGTTKRIGVFARILPGLVMIGLGVFTLTLGLMLKHLLIFSIILIFAGVVTLIRGLMDPYD